VTNNVVLYTALFDVDNPQKELMSQMSAQVFFVVAQAKDVLTVPVAALKPVRRTGGKTGARQSDTKQAGKPYRVTVLGPAGMLSEKIIRIGVQNRVSAEVLSGLEEGDRIVTGRKSQSKPQGAGGGQRRQGMPGGMMIR
jgi:macrolide-specific efflux system membrane fusion protein